MGRMGRAPELGDVLPPFVRNELSSLNGQQTKQLQALKPDVRTRLGAILTRQQMGQCQEALRRGTRGGPGGGPPRGPGWPQDDDGPPTRPGRPD
jgi:hypothetical protein